VVVASLASIIIVSAIDIRGVFCCCDLIVGKAISQKVAPSQQNANNKDTPSTMMMTTTAHPWNAAVVYTSRSTEIHVASL